MNAHTPFDANQDWSNPYCQNSSNDSMVDALLGNAYHVVRTVYCNLGNLKLIYDFLNQYGMVLGVQSEAELKALTTKAKYARIYGFSRAGDRQVTDYLYVEGDRTGIIPDDPKATGSWITVATSGSNSGGTSSGEGAYIPWVYSNGSATGGETTINVPDGTVGVPFIIVNGNMQYVGRGFEFNADNLSVTLAQPLEEGDEVVFLLTGVPAVPDNPNVNDWVQINWLYNNGAAVGGEQVIAIPYTFQSVPAVYKNGLRLYKGLTTESYTADPDNQRILLTEPLATNDRLIVQIGGEAQVLEASDHTLQEVARAANVKDSEVILSTDTTQFLNGKKIVYSVSEQKAYGLPVLPSNIFIENVSNGMLTYSPGSIQVNLLPLPASDALVQFQSNLAGDNGYQLVPSVELQRLRDAGDIRGWGCVCDGITDDSDNFQLAVIWSEANDKSLFIPGPILLTKKITFSKPPHIRGYKYSPPVIGEFQGTPYAHTGCIIYTTVASGLTLDINPPSNNQYIRGCNILDIHLLARGTGVTGSGIRIANCGWGGYIRGLVVEGFANGGVELSQLQDTKIDQLEVLNCGTDGVVAALRITNGSNLLAFDRIRLEANEYQMQILNSMMLDFTDSHFEQGDYPGASFPDLEKINNTPSIRIAASQNITFKGGFIFGATIQKQMAKFSIAASACPFHIAVGGDCSNINFNSVTMGFGYGSGRILEHHGSGIITACNFTALCTETYPLILDGNILFRNNNLSYTDNETSEIFTLLSAKYATIADNIFACVNPGSVNKPYGSLFTLTSANPCQIGRNQFIINKKSRFADGTYVSTSYGYDGISPSAGGVVILSDYAPNTIISLYGGSGGASPVTDMQNAAVNQSVTFCNNGTGNATINHGGNIACKGGIAADIPPGNMITFVYNPASGAMVEVGRSF